VSLVDSEGHLSTARLAIYSSCGTWGSASHDGNCMARQLFWATRESCHGALTSAL